MVIVRPDSTEAAHQRVVKAVGTAPGQRRLKADRLVGMPRREQVSHLSGGLGTEQRVLAGRASDEPVAVAVSDQHRGRLSTVALRLEQLPEPERV